MPTARTPCSSGVRDVGVRKSPFVERDDGTGCELNICCKNEKVDNAPGRFSIRTNAACHDGGRINIVIIIIERAPCPRPQTSARTIVALLSITCLYHRRITIYYIILYIYLLVIYYYRAVLLTVAYSRQIA